MNLSSMIRQSTDTSGGRALRSNRPNYGKSVLEYSMFFLATPTHLHSLLAAFPLFAYIKFKLKCWLFDTLEERTLRALQRVPGYKIGLPGRNVIITLALKCTKNVPAGSFDFNDSTL